MKFITKIKDTWKNLQEPRRFAQLATYSATASKGGDISLTYIPSGIYVLETSKYEGNYMYGTINHDTYYFHAENNIEPPHREINLQIHISPRGISKADRSLVRLVGLEDAIDSTSLNREFNSKKLGLSDYRAAHDLLNTPNEYPTELGAIRNRNGEFRKATVEEIASKFDPVINCYLWEQDNNGVDTVGGGILQNAVKEELEEQIKNKGCTDSAASIFASAAIRGDVNKIGFMLSVLPYSQIGASQERFDSQHQQTMEKIIRFIERFRHNGLSNSMGPEEETYYTKQMRESLQKLIPSTQVGKKELSF